MSNTRIIKKYANRRLYDTSTKAYITLADVKKLVYDQVDFRVIDAKTEVDITQSTLLQIIAEQEASPAAILTTDFLRNLISSYNEKSTEKFREYLDVALKPFDQQHKDLTAPWHAYLDFLQSLTPKASTKKSKSKK